MEAIWRRRPGGQMQSGQRIEDDVSDTNADLFFWEERRRARGKQRMMILMVSLFHYSFMF